MSVLGELVKVYDFFQANEWVQGETRLTLPDGKTGYCLNGMLLCYQGTETCDECGVKHLTNDNYRMRRAMRLALKETVQEMNTGCIGIIRYNDAEGRTREDIDQLFQRTISRLRENEQVPA